MSELFSSFNTTQGIVLMLLGFGFIIFIHELGHFLAAKFVGIKVTQFAVGFGPAIFAWRKGIGFRSGTTEPAFDERIKAYLLEKYEHDRLRSGSSSQPTDKPHPSQVDAACAALKISETEYRLNWLPLGGYVKMLGQEDMDPTAVSEDARAFNRKPAWARFLVLIAGVTMNLITGFLFLIIAFLHGVAFPPAVAGNVPSHAPAAQAQAIGKTGLEYRGLRPGDRFVLINGQVPTDFLDLAVNTALSKKGEPVKLMVERDGEAGPLEFHVLPQTNPNNGLLYIGVEKPFSTRLLDHPDYALPKAWEFAGVKRGMRIAEVDGKPVTEEQFHRVWRAVVGARGEPVQATFKNDKNEGAVVALAAQPEMTLDADGNQHLLGLQPLAKVAQVLPGKPAEAAGCQSGDVIMKLNGVSYPAVKQVSEIIKGSQGKSVSMVVLREGKEVELKPMLPENDRVGIAMEPATQLPRIAHTLAGEPASELNLTDGSQILAVNGQEIKSLAQLQRVLQDELTKAGVKLEEIAPVATPAAEKKKDPAAAPKKKAPAVAEVAITYELNIQGFPTYTRPVAIDAESAQQILAAKWALPDEMQYGFVQRETPLKADDWMGAAKLGVLKTHQFMMQVYVTLLRLFQGSVPISGMQGPVGIVHTGTLVAREGGLPHLFFLFGVISVNLVVINLLPIPITDGGQLVILGIERIKGSPVHPQILNWAMYAGLAVFGALFLTVTYFDIVRLLK